MSTSQSSTVSLCRLSQGEGLKTPCFSPSSCSSTSSTLLTASTGLASALLLRPASVTDGAIDASANDEFFDRELSAHKGKDLVYKVNCSPIVKSNNKTWEETFRKNAGFKNPEGPEDGSNKSYDQESFRETAKTAESFEKNKDLLEKRIKDNEPKILPLTQDSEKPSMPEDGSSKQNSLTASLKSSFEKFFKKKDDTKIENQI